jgi:trigger factor
VSKGVRVQVPPSPQINNEIGPGKLKTETETREDHQITLIVEPKPEVVEQFKKRAARMISKESKIAGFRPGKAPYDVVVRTKGEKVIEEQAIELLLDDIYPKALEEANIDPSGPGNLEEYPSLDPPKFIFVVPLKPEITLPDYRSIRKDFVLPEVNDDDVNATIHSLQIRHAVAEPVEDRPAKLGDQVYLTLTATLTEPKEDEDPALVTDQPLQIVIEEDPVNEKWPYHGFSKEVIGLSLTEEKSLSHSYPEDAEYEFLQSREVEFSFTVQNIQSLVLPELNDEFAQTAGEFSKLEELKEAVSKQLNDESAHEYEHNYMDGLIEEIVEGSTIQYPPHYLEEEIKQTTTTFERSLARQNMDLTAYLKATNTDNETFIENEIKPQAESSLNTKLVMQEILSAENIQLEPGEFQALYANAQQELSQSDYFKKLPKGINRSDLIEAASIETASRILNNRLMELLKAIAMGTADNIEEDVAEDAIPADVETLPVDDESADSEPPADKKTDNATGSAEEDPGDPGEPDNHEVEADPKPPKKKKPKKATD